MAEPKDDPDVAHFVQKVANHLGNSRLEEDLNDFFDLHAEELKNELRGSSESEKPAPPEKGEYGLRVHELYQDFLKVVQCNLEEFLEAEGLTKQELQAACEKEIRMANDSGGANFMHTLICSWEFESFVELATEFVDEAAEEDNDTISQASEESSSSSSNGSCSSCREQHGSRASNDTRCSAAGSDVASETKTISTSSCIGKRGQVGGGRRESKESSDGYAASLSIGAPREILDVKGVNERCGHDSDDRVVDALTVEKPTCSGRSEDNEPAGYRDEASPYDESLCMRAQAKS